MKQIFINKLNAMILKLKILQLSLQNRFYTKSGISMSNNRKKKIIVSLTTYPKRFNVVHLTIETLLHQSLKPDKIILLLAKDEVDYIPKHLTRLQNRGLEIRIVDENLKSYNKLFYTYTEYKNEIIITVDDDTLYPKWLVEKLYKKYLDHQNCIIAYRCSVMKKDHSGKLLPYLSWENAKGIVKPSFNLFFTGVAGVLYPPNSLSEEVFNKKKFLAICPTADDVWFKAMSLLNGVKTVQVFENCMEFPVVKGSQDDALWKINNGELKNDEQLESVFQEYNLYDLLDE